MEHEKFMQYLVVGLIAALMLVAISCMSARALLLEEGECWNITNDTQVCAANCTDITADACQGFIENATQDLRDKCSSFENLSLQIDSTFGTLDAGFMAECQRWKNLSESWKADYERCDIRLQDLDVNSVDDCRESLERVENLEKVCSGKLEDMTEDFEYATNNAYTGFVIGIILGLIGMWYFKVRKPEHNQIGEPEEYVASELR